MSENFREPDLENAMALDRLTQAVERLERKAQVALARGNSQDGPSNQALGEGAGDAQAELRETCDVIEARLEDAISRLRSVLGHDQGGR